MKDGARKEQLGGGFKDETKSVLVTDVAALESTQQEADTRVILYSIHSVQKEDVERIIIHTNDTDTVVISCVYYASTLLRDLSELSMWVRTARGRVSTNPWHGGCSWLLNQSRTAVHP